MTISQNHVFVFMPLRSSFRRVICFVVFLAVGTLCAAASVQAGNASPLNTITVETESGRHAWSVELASDNESRSKGLMFRKEMARDAGMLFRFDRLEPASMWMKNTFLALDMVFLDSDGRIASIHYGAVPQSLDIISSRGPVRYVLEINAGEAERTGLQRGQVMRHPWFLASN